MDQSSPSSEAAAKAADVIPAVKEEISKLADKSVGGSAEAVVAVGKAAEVAAQSLEEALPSLARYVRYAADQANKLADDLRDKKAGELMSSGLEWSKQQPLLTLAGAVCLGFALSRVVKAGAMPASDSASQQGGSDTEGSANAQ